MSPTQLHRERDLLTHDEARERVEVAYQLAELESHPAWAVLRDFVESRAIGKQNRLLGGDVVSIEEYKKEAGWLAGVRDVLTAPAAADKMAVEAREILGGDVPDAA